MEYDNLEPTVWAHLLRLSAFFDPEQRDIRQQMAQPPGLCG